jgi:hypothetical protein
MSGWLDKLSPALRHALIGLLAAVLTYATANYTSWGLPAAAYPIIGALLTIAGLWLTPFLTTQYGVGSSKVQPLPDQSVAQDA